jgi:hypothetical protein
MMAMPPYVLNARTHAGLKSKCNTSISRILDVIVANNLSELVKGERSSDQVIQGMRQRDHDCTRGAESYTLVLIIP